MVEEEVSIEAIVVPHLQMLLAFQVLLEVVDQSCILAEVINENSRATSEVELWACEEGSTEDAAFSHGGFLFDIQVYCFGVPSHNFLGMTHEYLHDSSALLLSSHNIHSWQGMLSLLGVRVYLHHLLLEVLKVAVVEVTEEVVQPLLTAPSYL